MFRMNAHKQHLKELFNWQCQEEFNGTHMTIHDYFIFVTLNSLEDCLFVDIRTSLQFVQGKFNMFVN